MKNIVKLSGIMVLLAVIGFSFAACGGGGGSGGCEPIDLVLYDYVNDTRVGSVGITFTEGTYINFDIDELKSALKVFIGDTECTLHDDYDPPNAGSWNKVRFDLMSGGNPGSVVTVDQPYEVTLVYTKPADAVGDVPFGYNHDLNGNNDPFNPIESFTFKKTVTAKSAP